MSYYVYFIQPKCKGNRPVKIGYSNDPQARLKTLQTANCQELRLCVSLPFDSEELAREAERTMHSLARKKHKALKGEWFMIYGCWKTFIRESMAIFDGNQTAKTH